MRTHKVAGPSAMIFMGLIGLTACSDRNDQAAQDRAAAEAMAAADTAAADAARAAAEATGARTAAGSEARADVSPRAIIAPPALSSAPNMPNPQMPTPIPIPGRPPVVSASAADAALAFQQTLTVRLPAVRLERLHASRMAACEALGRTRCVVVGMSYDAAVGSETTATLNMLIAPAIAREFTLAITREVVRADGTVLENRLRGEDAGNQIAASRRWRETLQEQIETLQRRRAAAQSPDERAQLDLQIDARRAALNQQAEGERALGEQLAMSRVNVTYRTGETVTETIAPSQSTAGGWDAAKTSALAGITSLLSLLGFLLPWALIAGAAWWVRRWWLQRSNPTLTRGQKGSATPAP